MRAVWVVVVATLAWPAAAAAKPKWRTGGLRVEVLSTRADHVTDGQALVAVRLPRRAKVAQLRVRRGHKDVTSAFALRDGRLTGLVTGLRRGRNEVVASLPGRRRARLTVTNHPVGGPVFGGPQPQPWTCQKTAVDLACNEPATFNWLYLSTDSRATGLQPYDRSDPPDDVATTTTDQGVRVPFVVREEVGYLARDEYRILVLADPAGGEWDRFDPPRTWNRKVVVPGGGGCGSDYGPDDAPLADFSGTLPAIPGRKDSYVDALGRGFAVMSTALANTGHNCNVVTNAEALIMTKERLIERYGDVRYTIGTGCSGGSIVQHTVANAYPGAVYDGLVVTCSYPDTFSAGAQFADYHLLRKYFEDQSRWGSGVVWSPHQWGAVEGHLTHVNAVVADEGLFKGALDPTGCVEGAYDPATNPGGVRCSVLDFMINVLGPRPPEVWGEQERKAGRGFAGIPFGNAGVQYGLRALREGWITAEQFVDLNEKIGGLDVDMGLTKERLPGDDAAIANSYRAGMMNLGDHLEGVAILAHGGPDPGVAHDFAHAWWMRDRLQRAQGHVRNHVLWVGSTPLVGDLTWPTQGLLAVDKWLAAVEADRSSRSRAHKIAVNRPDDVRDRCQYTPFVRLGAIDGLCLPDAAHLRLSTPREVAGGDRFNDTLKCELRPLDRSEYGLPGLGDEQFARLQAVFPGGVCDWSRKGVGWQPAVAWQTYQDAKGRVIHGGRAMRPAPRSRP